MADQNEIYTGTELANAERAGYARAIADIDLQAMKSMPAGDTPECDNCRFSGGAYCAKWASEIPADVEFCSGWEPTA